MKQIVHPRAHPPRMAPAPSRCWHAFSGLCRDLGHSGKLPLAVYKWVGRRRCRGHARGPRHTREPHGVIAHALGVGGQEGAVEGAQGGLFQRQVVGNFRALQR